MCSRHPSTTRWTSPCRPSTSTAMSPKCWQQSTLVPCASTPSPRAFHFPTLCHHLHPLLPLTTPCQWMRTCSMPGTPQPSPLLKVSPVLGVLVSGICLQQGDDPSPHGSGSRDPWEYLLVWPGHTAELCWAELGFGPGTLSPFILSHASRAHWIVTLSQSPVASLASPLLDVFPSSSFLQPHLMAHLCISVPPKLFACPSLGHQDPAWPATQPSCRPHQLGQAGAWL